MAPLGCDGRQKRPANFLWRCVWFRIQLIKQSGKLNWIFITFQVELLHWCHVFNYLSQLYDWLKMRFCCVIETTRNACSTGSFKYKIQKNWCTVTVEQTIEHHGGHSRIPATRGETRCPGGVSVSCLASRTRHECPRHNKPNKPNLLKSASIDHNSFACFFPDFLGKCDVIVTHCFVKVKCFSFHTFPRQASYNDPTFCML